MGQRNPNFVYKQTDLLLELCGMTIIDFCERKPDVTGHSADNWQRE